MKTFGILFLTISLGLNVVGWFQARHPAKPAPAPAAVAAVATQPEAAEALALRETAGRLHALLRAGELDTLAARLRAAGFPPEVVWHVIADAVRARHAAELKREKSDEFWRPLNHRTAPSAVQKTIDHEIEKIVGPSPERLRERSLDFAGIASEKIPLIEEIRSEYGERLSAVYEKENTFPIPEVDGPAVEQLERQRDEAIEALLSPDEKFEYRLRKSGAAVQLRYETAAMQPTEAEFRAIFASQSGTAPETVRQGELKAALGGERYADYQRAKDPGFQSLFDLVEQLQKPPADAVAVYDVQNKFKTEAGKIRNDAALSEVARGQALAALAQDAEAKITARLGEEGWAEFKKAHPLPTNP